MKILEDINETRAEVRSLQTSGKTVGLVPTMGALHDGHLSLVRAASKSCDAVAVTIFVNPTQFGANEDLSTYPRPLEADLRACESKGVDLVFTPSVDEMYRADASTVVSVGKVSEGLCGASRPGHFDGVSTVVTKLFNILPADYAFFGEKDYQQLQVIRRMVRDMDMPIEIVGCPIVREADGLAMSSRNAYLSPQERAQAVVLSRALFAAADSVSCGTRQSSELVEQIRQTIVESGEVEIDYIEVVDSGSLLPIELVDRPARICLAVRIGSCRLIDNIGIGESEAI